MGVFVLRVRVCTRVILVVSSVNYLENWQCLSIVDGSGKYVSHGQLVGGNSFQHLSTLGIKKEETQHTRATHLAAASPLGV